MVRQSLNLEYECLQFRTTKIKQNHLSYALVGVLNCRFSSFVL